MKLSVKLALLFLFMAVGPVAVVGYLSYQNGRRTIEQGTIDHLMTINTHKKNQLKNWIDANVNLLETISDSYFFKYEYPTVMAAHENAAVGHSDAHNQILTRNIDPFINKSGFFELFILRASDGKVMISTDERQEGKYFENQPYFLKGRLGTYIQYAYFSMALQAPAMTISVPLKDRNGETISVLAGRVDLASLSKIFSIGSGLHSSEDSYLINRFNFFVTEPKFGQHYALRKTIHTQGAKSVLAKKSGIAYYDDYRGLPVIGAFEWLPEWELGLITKIDQAEAYAPIIRLKRIISAIGLVIALIAAFSGWAIAQTITRPVQRLVEGTEKIGAGDLRHSVATRGKDEIGELSRAFDRMRDRLRETLVSRDKLTQEIEARKVTEASLTDSRNQLQDAEAFTKNILNSLTVHIAVLDENGVIVAVNDAWQYFSEENRGSDDLFDSIGVNYLSICEKAIACQDDQAVKAVLNGIRSVFNGTSPYYMTEYPCHTPKEQRWFHMWVSSLRGQRKGLVIAHSDITQRKLAEERVIHLNHVLRSIRDINRLIVQAKEISKLIQKACELLVSHRSYSSALIILTKENGICDAHATAGIKKTSAAALAAYLEKGRIPSCCDRAFDEDEIHHLPYDAESCSACPIFSGNTHIDKLSIALTHNRLRHGYLVVSLPHDLAGDLEELDLLKDMAKDIAFAVSNLKLGQTILRTEQERDQFQAQLLQSQKMEAVGRLAGGVAHDFNNMLSIITGYSEMVLDEISPNDPIYDNLNEILSAAKRSSSLTRQLLAFARKQTISPKILDLNKSVANHERMIRRLVGEDIDLRFMPGPDLWSILMDESQIDQILANLAVNSRDAISGVGIINIATDNIIIDQDYSRMHADYFPGEYVRLTFGDSGKGMTKEEKQHLFEPFFTTKEKGKGTGLGLSTIYGIVKQNNGFINFYSEPGHGTLFQIFFPRQQGEVSQVEAEEDLPVTGDETILVVEDEAQILRLSRKMLKQLGYHVLDARLPGEAIVICEKYAGAIDLMITDVVMPNMNGNELKNRIEQLKPGIRTLFMSGYTADVIAHRGVLSDGFSFIHKPFSLKELAQKVRETLNAKH